MKPHRFLLRKKAIPSSQNVKFSLYEVDRDQMRDFAHIVRFIHNQYEEQSESDYIHDVFDFLSSQQAYDVPELKIPPSWSLTAEQIHAIELHHKYEALDGKELEHRINENTTGNEPVFKFLFFFNKKNKNRGEVIPTLEIEHREDRKTQTFEYEKTFSINPMIYSKRYGLAPDRSYKPSKREKENVEREYKLLADYIYSKKFSKFLTDEEFQFLQLEENGNPASE